ncbi:MAG: hypothetical protein ACOCX4_01335 [Planctomycetota bacterium]
MNLAGKIFIILNMILSVAFAAASVSLYAKKVDWVQETNKHITKQNELQAQLDQTQDDLDAEKVAHEKLQDLTREQIQNLTKERNDLQSTVADLERENREWETKVQSFDTQIAKLQSLLTMVESDKQALTQDLQRIREQRDRAITDLEFAQKTALEATADVKELEAELQGANSRLAAMLEQNLELRITLDTYRNRFGSLEAVAAAAGPVSVRGKVLKVDESVDLVIINLGEADKLKTGMELVVSRGSEYIGKLKIRNLYENMASAVIDRGLTVKPVRIGDAVETM